MTAGNRAELRRDSVTEWYSNRPEGIEQGFTIDNRPAGRGKVVLAQEVSGAKAVLDGKGNAVLKDAKSHKTLLNYGKLSVEDASGKKLPSELQVKGRQLRIVYADEGARYPVTVDPLITAPATFLEGDQDTSYYGYAVSGAGDVNSDGYDDVIVGAYMYDNGELNEGAAFVYHGSASGISTTAAATLDANLAGSQFGYSVSGVGDVNGDGYGDVIVGAFYFANPTSNEGAAFVYHGSASGVSTTAAVTLDSNQSGAQMGASVSGGGDFNNDGYSDVIVGAINYDRPTSNEGAAFTYHGSASGISPVAAVTLDSNQATAYMGISVAGTGDVNGDGYGDVVVGAHYYDNPTAEEGAAFVYHGSASGISSSSSATLESNQATAYFGQSVSSAGDVNNDGYDDVIVGAYRYDNPTADEGAAFVYHGSGSGVSTTPAATVDGTQGTAWFGWSVSGAGDLNADGYDDVIVGAQRYDRPTPDEGTAYTYQGSSSGISTTTTDVLESNQGGSYFGISVSDAGDVNGDGYADVIVGARAYDNPTNDEGAAFVYHSQAAADTTDPTTTLSTSPITADGSAGWFKTAPTITLARNEGGSTGYRWDGASSNTAYSGAFAYSGGQGSHTLYYQSTDDAGNTEDVKSQLFKVDTVAPTNPALTSPTHATSQYSSNNQVTVNFGASSDATSGVASFSYAFDTNAASTPDTTADAGITSATSSALTDGTSHYFHLRTKDIAGNWSSASHMGPFYVDTAAPSASSNTPLNEATGVSVDTNTTVTFSEDVSQDTLTASTVTLKSSTNDTVAAVLSYDSPTKTVTINPNTNLLYSQTYTANVTAGVKDAAGNALNPAHTFSFTTAAPADTTPPTTTLTKAPSSADGDDSWYLSAPNLSLSANEGTQDTQYQWDSSAGAWASGNAPIPGQGSHTLYYRSIDTAGNTEDAKFSEIKLDSVGPANPTATTSSHPAGTTSSDVTIEMSFSGASDASSGVDGYSRSFTTGATDAADTTKDLEEGATGATSGSLGGGVWYFHLRTRDNAGNWAATQHYGPMTIDVTAPTTTLSTSPVSADGDDGWFLTSPTITLARSGSGSTGYRWDGAAANTAYSGAFAYNGGQGTHTLYYQSTDDVSNVEAPLSQAFKVDTVAPTNPALTSSTHVTSQYSSNNQVTVNFGASSDASSGVSGFSYEFDTSATTTPNTVVDPAVTSVSSAALADGTSHYFHLRSRDVAGNWSAASHFGPFYIDTTAPSVTSTSPIDEATEVATTTNITVTFSDNMSSDTIIGANFELESSTGDPVSGALSWDGGTKTATLNPTSNLLTETEYTATVSTGVKDEAGNSMAAPYEFSFTTGAETDTAPPSAPRRAWSHVFSTTEARLYWSGSTDDTAVTQYEIYDDVGALIGSSASTSFDLPVLTPGDTYRYRIKACDDAGNKSAYSNTVVVKAAYSDTTSAGAGNDSPTIAPSEGYSITYFDVTEDGLTTVAEIPSPRAAPTNVTFLGRTVNITTTSGFDGEIIVGVSYTEGAVSNESRLRLYHFENGQWDDITTYVDTENNIVFGATTSLSPFVVGNPGSGGGWWKESTADPLGSAEWQSQAGNSGYGSPHGGFSTTSNLCKTCHAVHNSMPTSYRLLKNTSRFEECNYCHMGVSGLSKYRLYAFEDLGLPVKGEHSLGSTEVPDSTLVGQSTNRSVSADAETGQLVSRGGPYDDNGKQQLYCYSCHSVHGANTITDPLAGGWTRRILRINPGGAPGAFNANDGLNVINATALGFSGMVSNDNTSYDSRALTPVKTLSTIRGVFCGSCHNRNFNFRENEDDGHDYSLQRASHPMGTDGTLDAGGGAGFTGNTKVSWQNVAWCGSCHASPVEIGGATPDAGSGYAGASGTDKNSAIADTLDWGTTWYASGFPHQSSSNKLLFESYTDGARDATQTNDAFESLSNMDSVCVRCHSEDGTFNPGVSGVGSSF